MFSLLILVAGIIMLVVGSAYVKGRFITWTRPKNTLLSTLAIRPDSIWSSTEKVVIEIPRDDLYNRALDLVAQHEVHSHAGEWKRHQVYARLLKEFPTRLKSEIGLVIEVVFREI